MAHESPAVPLLVPSQEVLAALLAGDRPQCVALTEQALASGVNVTELYQRVYEPALYQIGQLWEANRISVATEHMATAIIESLLNQVYPRVISARRAGRLIVVSTAPGELHQIGAKMVCDVFEMHGWDAVYTGAGATVAEILGVVRAQRPDCVGLSLSVGFHLNQLQDMLTAIRAEFPDLPVLVGGQGLRRIGMTPIQTPGVHYLADLDALRDFIFTLTSG